MALLLPAIMLVTQPERVFSGILTAARLAVSSSGIPSHDFVACTSYCCQLVLHVNQHADAHGKKKRVETRSCTQVSKQQQQLAHAVKYLICFRPPLGAALKVELFLVIIVVMFVLYSRRRLRDSIGVHRERSSTRRPKCSLTPFVPQGTYNGDSGEGKRKSDSHRTDYFRSERIQN